MRRQVLRRFEAHFEETRRNLVATDRLRDPDDLGPSRSRAGGQGDRSMSLLLNQLREQEEFTTLRLFRRRRYSETRYPPGSLGYEKQLVRRSDVVVGDMTFEGRSSPMEALRKVCRSVFSLNFAVDNGVPYPVDPTKNILAVDRAPLGRFDPEKPARAAAFAGWAMAEAPDPERVLRVADRLRAELQGVLD